MKLSIRYAATLAVALVATLVVASSPAQAIESFGIGVIPAHPRQDNPRTKSIFVYEAAPPQVIDDGIRVVNNSKTKRVISMYPVDSERSSDGAFACAQAVQEKTGVGSWIRLAKNEVTLEPGQNEIVPFTVTLPTGAEVGEHNGCIAIQEAKPVAQTADKNGIVLSFRSALRVAVVVPGDVRAELAFKEVKSTVKGVKTAVSPLIANTGNISVDANLHVALTNILGQKVVAADGQFAVLSKDESRFNFELDSPFWGGWYHVDATADYIPLRLEAQPHETRQTITTPSTWLYVAPQPLASMVYTVVVVGAIGVAVAWCLRRRHWRLMQQRTTRHTVVAGDTLQSLAEQSGVGWKKLAKLNGLAPPYTLAPGQTVKLPVAGGVAAKKARHKG